MPSAATRQIEPICPTWCMGHTDPEVDGLGYQDWMPWIGGTLARDHDSESTTVEGISVTITQIEVLTEGIAPAQVWVSEDSADVETHRFTPDRARDLAAAITRAADRIDAEASR